MSWKLCSVPTRIKCYTGVLVLNVTQVYWLGPILGGISAALIYKHAFSAVPVEVTTDYTPVQVRISSEQRDVPGLITKSLTKVCP